MKTTTGQVKVKIRFLSGCLEGLTYERPMDREFAVIGRKVHPGAWLGPDYEVIEVIADPATVAGSR